MIQRVFFFIYSPRADSFTRANQTSGRARYVCWTALESWPCATLCAAQRKRRSVFLHHNFCDAFNISAPQGPSNTSPCRRWVQRNCVSLQLVHTSKDYFRGNSLGSSLAELMASLRASDAPLDTPSERCRKWAAFGSDQTTTNRKEGAWNIK